MKGNSEIIMNRQILRGEPLEYCGRIVKRLKCEVAKLVVEFLSRKVPTTFVSRQHKANGIKINEVPCKMCQ